MTEPVDTAAIRGRDWHTPQWDAPSTIDELCNEIDRLRTVIAACDQEIAEFHDDVLRHSQRIEEAVKLLRHVRTRWLPDVVTGWHDDLNATYRKIDAFLEQQSTE